MPDGGVTISNFEMHFQEHGQVTWNYHGTKQLPGLPARNVTVELSGQPEASAKTRTWFWSAQMEVIQRVNYEDSIT